MPGIRSLLTALAAAVPASAQTGQATPAAAPQPDPAHLARTEPRSPAATIASVQLPPGYRLEVVACEPMIREPVAIAWDGNGRLYVAEMRTYMQDIDGTDEHAATSRISRLEDTDGDGRMDTHSVFVDGLVLPRMILPLQDSVIVRETDTLDLHEYRDTDGDGVADEKTLVYEGGKRGGNLEHQPSGLEWNVDNYLYVTYTNKRYRYRGGRIEAHPLPAGEGQWGITHDDWGQCFYSRAGGEVVAAMFQQNMQYGKLSLPGELAEGFHECWPIDDIPDVQGGLPRVRDDGSLNHFTGCCGQTVFRGDRLPEELRGNLFVPEPVGRLIRRATITDDRGKRVLHNPHERSEFLRTDDANFRPVNMETAPDGTLYIVDMYRGIIQEGNWVREGSYLRGVVQQYGLDRNIGRGRIYRLVHDDFEPGPRPRMLDQSSAELVQHLSHANGWWRDNAQKLLVLRGDASVVPALEALLRDGATPVARMHALWTLDGLDRVTMAHVQAALADGDARLRATAVRVAERFVADADAADADADYDADEQALAAVRAAAADPTPAVRLQVLRTALYTRLPGYEQLVERIVADGGDNDAYRLTAKGYFDRLAREKAEAERRAEIARQNARLAAAVERGATIYQSLCFACHGNDGAGMPIPGVDGQHLAPSLVGSPRVLGSTDRLGRIVLHGLQGPVDGKTYPGLMVGMAANNDEWIADVLTFVRNSWGNQAAMVESDEVAALREATEGRSKPWTLAELKPFDPPLRARAAWRLSADRNQGELARAIDGDDATRWTTGETQRPGSWLVIELPEAVTLTGCSLDTRGSANDFPQRYEVRTSADGERWSEPIAKGKGSKDDPIIRWQPTAARFVKITQLGKKPNLYWSIHELHLFGDGNPLPK